MLADRFGLPLSTSSAAARDAYVEASERALTFYPGARAAYDDALAADPIEALSPLTGQNERIGGSRAQHDLIEFTLLKSYLAADQQEEARHLLKKRRPNASGVPIAGVTSVQ
jgi:hypothetical protein